MLVFFAIADSVTGEVTAKRSGLPAKNGPTSSSMTSLWSTTTAGEEPQGRVAGWAASFDRLLQDPIGLRYFMVSVHTHSCIPVVCKLK